MDGNQEVYYRYVDYSEGTGYTDVCGEFVFTGSVTRVRVKTFKVIKFTLKGAWIRDSGGDERFVLTGTRKCYAHPTIEEALESFKARKNRQKSIYEARANAAQKAIDLAEKGKMRTGSFGDFILW